MIEDNSHSQLTERSTHLIVGTQMMYKTQRTQTEYSVITTRGEDKPASQSFHNR